LGEELEKLEFQDLSCLALPVAATKWLTCSSGELIFTGGGFEGRAGHGLRGVGFLQPARPLSRLTGIRVELVNLEKGKGGATRSDLFLP
jgi:hypothetical protein